MLMVCFIYGCSIQSGQKNVDGALSGEHGGDKDVDMQLHTTSNNSLR